LVCSTGNYYRVRAHRHNDTGLSCGAAYYYRVRAYRQSGGLYSNYTSVVNVATLPCAKLYVPLLMNNYP